jgi:hypothetical protein
MDGNYRKELGSPRNQRLAREANVLVVSLALLGLLTFLSSTATAQTGFAALRGNVTDASGAVVTGAQVTLTEPATGLQVRTAESDAQGNFEFPNLKPGSYQVKSEKQGFKAFVADDIKLDAGQTRRLDIRFSVGNQQETVEVRAGAAVINTEGGTISGQFEGLKVADTPLIDTYPSPLALFATLPGVQGNGWDLKISGQDASQQSIQADGVSNDRAGEQSNTSKFFEEATVTTVNAPADSSRVVAYNLTSKRGENQFHGMVYYQHFNAGLNATPHPQTKRTPYIQHDWQAELGGPIWKNHTFFYVSWYEQLIPLGSFNLATVPTQAMWNGDFTGFPTIFDPQTGQSFPNNKIPANRISPVSAAVQKYYPLPNVGDPTTFTFNNFGWTHPYNSQNYRGDWPFFRIDHNLTSKNTIFGRWLQRKTPFVLPGTLPSTFWTRLRDHRQTVVSDTHVFSPKVINNFRFGWNTDYIIDGASEAGQKPLNGGTVIAAIGLQGVNLSGYNVAGIPEFDITDITYFKGVNGGVKNDDRTLAYEDSLTWQEGRHIWKFGGEVTTFKFHSGVIPDYGTFNFNGAFTGGSLGSGFADFLLGLPQNSKRSDPFVNRTLTNKEVGLYIMDTFKLTPRLTLDYGLRWDYYALPTYTDGLMYNFDLASGTVLVPQSKLSQVNPLYPSNIPIAAGQVTPDASLRNFRPRIAASYLLGKSFVIRGGYGQFTDRYSRFYSDLAENQGPGPFAHLAESFTNTTPDPLFSFPNPFPSPSLASPAPSQTMVVLPRKWNNGVIHQFNVSVEKEIAKMGLRASYIGSRSKGLNFIANSITGSWINVNVVPASLTPFDTSRQPFPNLSGVYAYRSDGEAKYDALQLEASRKQGWVTFDAHYTWASSLNNMANTDDPSQPTKVWAVDHGLRRNLLTVTSVWNLPFGKGRQHLTDAPKVVDVLLGGWAVQTISFFGSGDYMTPLFFGFDVANNNFNSFIPDVIPGTHGNLPAGQRTQSRWYNTAAYHQDTSTGLFVYDQIGAFKVPGCSDTDPLCLNTQPANVGRFGNAGTNSLVGPRLNVHHLSLAKTFPLTERVRTTFTAEFADIFNHAHFYDPDTYINAQDAGQLIYARGDYEPEKAGHRQISFKLRFDF